MAYARSASGISARSCSSNIWRCCGVRPGKRLEVRLLDGFRWRGPEHVAVSGERLLVLGGRDRLSLIGPPLRLIGGAKAIENAHIRNLLDGGVDTESRGTYFGATRPGSIAGPRETSVCGRPCYTQTKSQGPLIPGMKPRILQISD